MVENCAKIKDILWSGYIKTGVNTQNKGVIPLTGVLLYEHIHLLFWWTINRLFKLWKKTTVHIFAVIVIFFFGRRATKDVCFSEPQVRCNDMDKLLYTEVTVHRSQTELQPSLIKKNTPQSCQVSAQAIFTAQCLPLLLPAGLYKMH